VSSSSEHESATTSGSNADQLTEAHQRRKSLEQWLSRLSSEVDRFSEEVRRRVGEDYKLRFDQVTEVMKALEDGLRHDLQELEATRAEVTELDRSAALDREEIEMRGWLGEFDSGEGARRLAPIDQRIAANQQRLAELAQREESILAVLQNTAGPDDECRGPMDDESPATQVVEAPADDRLDEEVANQGAVRFFGRPDPAAAAPAPLTEGDATVRVPLPSVSQNPTDQPDADPPASSVEKTTIAPLVSLVPESPIDGVTAYPVEPLTFIGRSSQNQIQLDDDDISRQHAKLTWTQEGYLLTDLDSGNGTYVNGEAIGEHVLVDGDKLRFGTIGFLFRSIAPIAPGGDGR